VAAGYGCVVGVDVGETRVRVELFDLALTELAAADLPLSDSGHDVDHVVRLILDGLSAVVRDAGISESDVLGVGVGVPGIVGQGDGAGGPGGSGGSGGPGGSGGSGADLGSGEGIVVHGQTIGWNAVPFGRLLRAGTDLPLYIDNGAKTL
ncbi:ROK family protein, partial [Pseudomonas sp. SID14000]|uniref:ROK family protein n=1 Tax=Pseudomonas sp. SID14000 TaxID=1986221 RepID=UPI00111DEFF1